MNIQWDAAGRSDVGRLRQGNEDALRLDTERGIFLVADGMGGHAAGEIASAIAADTVTGLLGQTADSGCEPEEISATLVQSFQAASDAIVQRSARNPRTRGMGTTVTACILCSDGTGQLGHIGDSRAYRLRGTVLEQLTRDHTWVQREIDSGRLSPDAAHAHSLAHVLTRVLCADTSPVPDVVPFEVRPGDLLLLSTDGLHGVITDEAIAQILTAELPLTAQLDELIAAANASGGPDNITALLIRIL